MITDAELDAMRDGRTQADVGRLVGEIKRLRKLVEPGDLPAWLVPIRWTLDGSVRIEAASAHAARKILDDLAVPLLPESSCRPPQVVCWQVAGGVVRA